MILKDCEKVIFLNAGHHNLDPGHISVDGLRENDQTKIIRDKLAEKLKKQGIRVQFVTDNLVLRESIDLVNILGTHLNSGLALDIHLNAHGSVNTIIQGTEVYSGTSIKSKQIANTISRHISKKLGTRDRGYRPDTWTAAGSLGWVRQTNMWSCVVEVCYMDDPQDLNKLLNGGHDKSAEGIARAVCELFGLEYTEEKTEKKEAPKENKEDLKELQKQLDGLASVVAWLKEQLNKLLKNSGKDNSILSGIYEILK